MLDKTKINKDIKKIIYKNKTEPVADTTNVKKLFHRKIKKRKNLKTFKKRFLKLFFLETFLFQIFRKCITFYPLIKS